MIAQCSADGTCIFLKKYDKPNPDQFFGLQPQFNGLSDNVKNEIKKQADYIALKI